LRIAALAGVLLSSLLAPICASAALGGDVVSVNADQQQMRATRAVQANGKYSVHVITTPYGTVVREYVSPDGKVFGVAWRGPFLPNLQQILGSYYEQFMQGAQAARAAEPRRSANKPLSVDQPELVLRSGGRVRAYAGHAYVPGMIPTGVAAQEIR
jgi:hypothetical protein